VAISWGRFDTRTVVLIPIAMAINIVLGGIGYYGFLPFYTDGNFTFFGDTSGAAPVFVLLGYLIALAIIAAIVIGSSFAMPM
jgi:hypothetical protein